MKGITMDNSTMAKAGTVKKYDPYKHDKGQAKLSRNLELNKVCDCEPGCKCNCVKVGDPLSWHNPCGGGKIV